MLEGSEQPDEDFKPSPLAGEQDNWQSAKPDTADMEGGLHQSIEVNYDDERVKQKMIANPSLTTEEAIMQVKAEIAAEKAE